MADKIRQFDWASNALGPIDAWPMVLRFAVETVLSSHFPKCLAWGDGLTMLYNDAFRPILGQKPEALGRPFNEVWAEAWPVVGPIAERAFEGESTFVEDFPLIINRNGFDEQTYFTFCYSPVRDEAGRVVALMDTVIETTSKVNVERRLREATVSLSQQVAQRTADRDRLWLRSDALLLVARFDGGVVAVNPAWTEWLGWSEQETVGRPMRSFAHSEDEDLLDQEISQLKMARKNDTASCVCATATVARAGCRGRHRQPTDSSILWAAT